MVKRLPMGIAAVTVAYNYAVITWCSFSIWRRLKANGVQLSSKTEAMHRQMNKMLVIQAIGPILLVVSPLIMMFVVTYQRRQEAPELMLVCTMLSWITLLNPLSTIYFVKAYRFKALEILLCRPGKVQPSRSADPTTCVSGLSIG
ncbi:CRE-STR-4 protein [Aphelenchoides avenae]|nr:CRE-STR-4 protein [Aphelenchus avenae]